MKALPYRKAIALLFVIVCLGINYEATAQSPVASTDSLYIEGAKNDSISADYSIEFILSQIDNEEDRMLVGEKLRRLADNPIDLNSATAEELAELPFVDDFFIRNLLLYRFQNGPFYTIYDLKGVQGAPTHLPFIEPFITVEERLSQGKRRRTIGHIQTGGQKSENSFLWVIDSQKEFGWSFSAIGEKDRGEKLLPVQEGVMDHLAVNVNLHRKNKKMEWIVHLGDYRVTTGRGLVMGMSYSYFSGLEMGQIQSSRWQKTLRAHRSQREYGFFRGAAASIKSGSWSLTPFLGWEILDARITEGSVGTIYTTGMHCTPQEIARRHNALRRAAGAYVTLEKESAHIGLLAVHHAFYDKQFKPLEPKLPTYVAVDWELLQGDFKWLGEAAWGMKGKEHAAAIAGFTYAPKQNSRLTVLGRYLGEEYNAPYRQPDARYSTGRNEYGAKLLYQTELGYNLTGQFYTDFYKAILEEPRRRSSKGNISSIRVNYMSYKAVTAIILRSNINDREKSFSLRGTMQLPLKDTGWSLKPSARVNKTVGTKGLTYAAALRARYENAAFRFESGAHYFACEEGAVRAEEPFMPYVYYTPMLRGKGVHLSAMARYNINPKIYLAGRALHTYYIVKPNNPLPFSYHLSLNIKF